MTAPAAEQLRRLLHLIPELADGDEHALEEVAGRAGVDVGTLVADLRALADRYDDPGGFVEGVQIEIGPTHARVRTDHFLRPMRLTTGELRALELGLAMIQRERPPAERDAIARARARLEEAIVETDDDFTGAARHADLAATAHPGHLAALRAGLRDRRVVKIGYRKSGATEPADRDVRPYALVAGNGAWYLVAHCEAVEGLRVFRLDRVTDAEVRDDARFDPPADFSIEQVVKEGRVFAAPDAGTMKVRYSPRIARWIAEREGRAPDADKSITVEHPLADHAWAVRHVLQYGADAEVLEPASVREALATRLRAMLGASA
jgi:proteasome accessory factor C